MPTSAPAVPLDLVGARRWALTARALLGEQRERIDALNVFPVPDGDTGTNMFLTFDGALEALRGHLLVAGDAVGLEQGLALIARGMLLSARGNSGVILSQLAGGLHDAVAAADRDHPAVDGADGGRSELDGALLADAFARADAMAWSGVSTPVEGTILSVARAAAAAAAACVAGDGQPASAHDVAAAALEAAHDALRRTTDQLPALARAGVVDAGGAGLVLVLEALERVLSGAGEESGAGHHGLADDRPWLDRQASPPSDGAAEQPGQVGAEGQAGAGPSPCGTSHEAGDGAFEVMFLLTDSDPERAEHLRAHLGQLGSSVQVAGGPELWRVHVHLDQPEAAVESGTMAGRVEQVTVTRLTDDAAPPPPVEADRAQVGVVACASGDGVAALFTEGGARVVRSAPGARASTGQLLNAIWAVHAQAVLVLPNDPDVAMSAHAAAAAAAEDGLTVKVVPSVAAVQGLAALAVCDPDSGLDACLSAMTQAVAGTRFGALTHAARAADTPAGPCLPGQPLGLVSGAIVAVGDALADVAAVVLGELVDADTELITVIAGQDADRAELEPLVEAAVSAAGAADPDVLWIDGGQRSYPWLLGAE